MTNHTEARLAREAEIAYASLSMVTDYDCWSQEQSNVNVEMVIENLKSNAEVGNRIMISTIQKIAEIRPKSEAHTALRDGLMTQKEKVPNETRKKLDLFTSPYWGNFEQS